MFDFFKYQYVCAVGFDDDKGIVVYKKHFSNAYNGLTYGFVSGALLGVFLIFATPITMICLFNPSDAIVILSYIFGWFLGFIALINCVKYIGYKYNNFDVYDVYTSYYDFDDNAKKELANMIKNVKTNKYNVRVLSHKNSVKFVKSKEKPKDNSVDKLFNNFINDSLCDTAKVK